MPRRNSFKSDFISLVSFFSGCRILPKSRDTSGNDDDDCNDDDDDDDDDDDCVSCCEPSKFLFIVSNNDLYFCFGQ